MRIEFLPFDYAFLKFSWTWLNDPDVKHLTNSNEFTREEQLQWFKTLPERKDYIIWGIKADAVPIGACGLKNITEADCEYWGYIGNKQFWGRGIGKEIMLWSEKKARLLGKSSIWLIVLKENIRAIGLYKSCGYSVEEETDCKVTMRKQL